MALENFRGAARLFAVLTALFISAAAVGQQKGAEKLNSFIGSHSVPAADFLSGSWRYRDNMYVFFKGTGDTPSKDVTDNNLTMMTVTSDNCELAFLEGNRCSFRVGNKKFTLTWQLDPQTREFKTSLPFFTIKGYLVRYGKDIALVYTRSDLELMMRFLCPASTHGYINDFSRSMKVTDGLSLCFIFSRN